MGLKGLTCTIWTENLARIKLGGLALKGCELHLADFGSENDVILTARPRLRGCGALGGLCEILCR